MTDLKYYIKFSPHDEQRFSSPWPMNSVSPAHNRWTAFLRPMTISTLLGPVNVFSFYLELQYIKINTRIWIGPGNSNFHFENCKMIEIFIEFHLSNLTICALLQKKKTIHFSWDIIANFVFISGIDIAEKTGLQIFHAGTSIKDGNTVTNGGRVLAVIAVDRSFKMACEKATEGAKFIQFENSYFRKDIGFRVLMRLLLI